jgi:hypothetical protein
MHENENKKTGFDEKPVYSAEAIYFVNVDVVAACFFAALFQL